MSRCTPWLPLVLAAAVLLPPACGGACRSAARLHQDDQDDQDDGWLDAHRAWRREREAALRSPDGYLALVRLHWLHPGDRVVFGTDPSCDLVLPAGSAPGVAGVLERDGGTVRLSVASGVRITAGGVPVQELDLATDADGQPTRLALGRLEFWVVDRAGALAVRVRDPESPLLSDDLGTETWAPEVRWRVPARLCPFPTPRVLDVPNVMGTSYEDTSPGELVFRHEGREHRLLATGDPAEGLFVVFGDATNGESTYGGGRFLEVAPPDDQGRVLLDFNRAYNPPCAYSAYTTCPLPPEGNRLPFEVTAGERAPDPDPGTH